jgi:hypothetical protein
VVNSTNSFFCCLLAATAGDGEGEGGEGIYQTYRLPIPEDYQTYRLPIPEDYQTYTQPSSQGGEGFTLLYVKARERNVEASAVMRVMEYSNFIILYLYSG